MRKDIQPPELGISLEKALYIIVKAREFDSKVPPEASHSSSNATDDDAREILEDFADDPTAEELRAAIDGLSDEEVIDLIAATWVGRGDFDRSSWNEARALAAERHRKKSSRYLMGIPNLGDCIEEGFAELGFNFEDYSVGRL